MNRTRVGQRNERIKVIAKTRAEDGQGGYTETKAELAEVWAYIHPAHFSNPNSGGGSAVAITQGMTIKSLDGIDESCEVIYKGKTYEILNIDESVIGEQTLTCMAVMHRG